MTEPSTPTAENSRTGTAARIGWATLIIITLYVCYFSHLGAIGFVGPDEPRYAWIARDMMETGDWVTPRLYGKPWFEKPPLFYWGAALCFKTLGVSEAAARLPSAVSALLATLALAWLALRLYGAETARWLLLLLPTTVGMIGFSHAAATDMPFSGMLTIAMVCAAVILGLTRSEHTPILPRTPWLALILFGFFLGLAVLAKGPAAIILCGAAVFFWALFTKRWREGFRLLHPVAIASFCVTALPWYILCARRNPDFLRVFIVEHNFERYLTPEFQHIQPFWFYAPVLLVAFLPWAAPFLWSSAYGATHLLRTRCAKESVWFLISWSGFCLAFFTVSRSKLPGYILPAVPAIALLIALSMSSPSPPQRRALIATMLSVAVGLGLLGVLLSRPAMHVVPRYASLSPLLVLALYALATSTCLLGLSFLSGLLLSNPTRNFLIAASLSLVLFIVGSARIILERANLLSLSANWLAEELHHDSIPADRLRVFHISRSSHYALNFYLHHEIKDWDTEPVENGYVLSNGLYCEQLRTNQKCVDLWGMRDFSSGSWALLRVTDNPSVQGISGSGEAHKKE